MDTCSAIEALLFFSPTVSGKIHDKTLLVFSELSQQFFTPYATLAFVCIQLPKGKLLLPHKKTKNTKTEIKESLIQQKEFNRQHAKIRVTIEHLFVQLKVIKILKNTLRNYQKRPPRSS